MLAKRLTVWLMIQVLLITQTAAIAQPSHDQGVAAGRSANTTIRGLVNQPSASSVVPDYTSTPAEAALAGRPALGAAVSAKLAACAATPNDPSCQAVRNAITSADTPRPGISASDPSVAAASRIARNPSLDLGDLSAYYSGCATSKTTIAGHTETRSCSRFVSSDSYTCSNSLTVSVARQTNCSPGDWIAEASSGRTAIAAQCLPDRTDSNQRFRVTQNGNPVAFFDVDMTRQALSPQKVAAIGRSGPNETVVYVADRSCTAAECSLTAMIAADRVICSGDTDSMSCTTVRPFIDAYSQCPAGTTSGDNLSVSVCVGGGDSMDCTTGSLDTAACYAPSAARTDFAATDITGALAAYYWRINNPRSVVGWAPNPAYGPIPQMHLAYTRAATTIATTDAWINRCPTLAANGRCSVATAPACVDGPSTKTIEGVPVTRDCWQYESSMTCSGTDAADQCAPLVAAGCIPASSACSRTNTATGACEVFQDQYTCTVPDETVTQAANCPANVFCFQGNCYNTSYTNDADFARSMSMLEAARQAGVYLDTDRMTVFNGEARSCRDRVLKNCCTSDGSGAGMSNQSMLGVGSMLVFDALMSGRNFDYVRQGLIAFLTSNTSFTAGAGTGAYGITIEFFTGDAVVSTVGEILYSSAITETTGMIIAFDPWTLALAVVITVVLAAMSCNSEEALTALSEGARLCRSVGTYCSSCIRVLGRCVACIEHTTGKCCFNSLLARIVNEQGRAQVGGKGWGSGENPDCSGFTIAQLQSLDFARMDLTEFYASLVAKSPDLTTIQSSNAAKVSNCYYGQGKC